MKEEKKDYALIVTASIVRDISALRRNDWFYTNYEEEEWKEEEASQEEATSKEIEEDTSEEITPTISCHLLARISTPQTLKLEGYIKRRRYHCWLIMVVLIISFTVN